MTKGNWSRVLTVLGLVLLLSTAVSFFLFDSRLLAAGKLVLGAAGLGAGIALSEAGGLRRFFTGRALHFGFFTALSGALLVGLLAVANWAAYRWPVSLDLTKNRIWSLSDDTVRLLAGLDRDVEALAFYGPGDGEYRPARTLLDQYAARSPRFRPRLIDPVAAPDLLREYGVTAGQPRLVLTAGGRTEKAEALTEEALSNALVRLTHAGARRVYFTEGHGELALRDETPGGLSTAARQLEGQGYQVATVSLHRDGEVPADAAALLVVAPKLPLLDGEVAAIRRYLARGGGLAALVDPEITSGLEPILADFGMELEDDLVLDASPAAQAMGGNASTPVVQPAGEHPITRSLAAARLPVILNAARSVVALTAAPVRARPLLLTSETAWGETDLAGLRDPARGVARGDGEKGGPMPVAMAAEQPQGKGRARVVAVGDGDLAANGYLVVLGNKDFFLNTVGWLAAQEDRITVRPRARDASVVFLNQGQALTLAVVSIDVVPVLLLGLGLAMWLVRRSR